MDRFGYTKGQVTQLRDMDLLYPNTTYVHASHFTDEEWALARDSGGNVSFAPQIEVQMGHGWAPAVKALEYGIPIGLSSDVATTASADQFTQMHAIFGSERGRKHQEAWDADLDGLQASPGLITSRQVLRWATLGGAEVAGIADRTGSITPGKKADIVIIDTKAVNVAPVIDPVGAVVCAADISNVRRRCSSTARSSRTTSGSGRPDRAAEGRRGVTRLPALEVRRARRAGCRPAVGRSLRPADPRLGLPSGASPATLRAPSGGRSYPQGRPPERSGRAGAGSAPGWSARDSNIPLARAPFVGRTGGVFDGSRGRTERPAVQARRLRQLD